jgi:hypothetical protein
MRRDSIRSIQVRRSSQTKNVALAGLGFVAAVGALLLLLVTALSGGG